MPLISIIVTLAVLGLVLWLVNTYIPMAEPIKIILNIVVVVGICIWLLSITGILDGPAFRMR